MLTKTLGGALGGAIVIIFLLWNQNGNLREKLRHAEAAISHAGAVNDNNLTTIHDLTDQLNACVTQREVDRTANEAVVSGLKSDIETLERQSVDTRIEREEQFREPSCKELGDIDINAVCPDLASGLRESANSLDRGGNSGS